MEQAGFGAELHNPVTSPYKVEAMVVGVVNRVSGPGYWDEVE